MTFSWSQRKLQKGKLSLKKSGRMHKLADRLLPGTHLQMTMVILAGRISKYKGHS